MKINCTLENIKSAVINAERFSGKHVTLPILSYILFRAGERGITITTTNLEFGIEIAIPGKVVKQGFVAVPAKTLSSTLQLLTDSAIGIEVRGNIFVLSSPTSEIEIQTVEAEDFPKFPMVKHEYTTTLPGYLLHQNLPQTLKSVSVSDFKPELTGIFFAFTNDGVIFVGTDSFRLTERTVKTQEKPNKTYECIVPARTCQELLRILNGDESVTITIGENQILFEWGGVKLISRLVDGTFPPYQNVIPHTFESTLVVARQEFISKIKLASVFASRLNDVTITYTSSTLEVATTHPELGRTVSKLSAKTKGVAGTIVFNYHYLLDGLESFNSEEIALHISNDSGKTLIQDPNNALGRYLLMPIRPV